MSGINSPSPLLIGNLPSTPSVSIGVGGALTVSNGSSPATVTVAGGAAVGALVCTSIAAAGTVSCGSNSMTCGALSSGSIAVGSGATISADVGTSTAPALVFGTDSSTGVYRASAGSVGIASFGASVFRAGSSKVDVFVPLAMNGNSVGCGGLTSSGAVSSGTNAMTCGALSCASVASSGNVTQPRYALRVYKASNQTVTNSTSTGVSWDSLESSSGSGFAFSAPGSLVTVPIAGTYLVTFSLLFASNGTGQRYGWVELNNGGSPGTGRRLAQNVVQAPSAGTGTPVGAFSYAFAANDTIQFCCFQSSGGSLALQGGGSGSDFSMAEIFRLSE